MIRVYYMNGWNKRFDINVSSVSDKGFQSASIICAVYPKCQYYLCILSKVPVLFVHSIQSASIFCAFYPKCQYFLCILSKVPVLFVHSIQSASIFCAFYPKCQYYLCVIVFQTKASKVPVLFVHSSYCILRWK